MATDTLQTLLSTFIKSRSDSQKSNGRDTSSDVKRTFAITLLVIFILSSTLVSSGPDVSMVWAGAQKEKVLDAVWIEEIEKTFIPSKHCKQCHDRHYEEWKGMRELTEDLKTLGRVDGALLHGNALKSSVFKTVLGLWLETKPDRQQRTQCLACHAPAVTVFPQYTDRIISQVMAGPKHVKVEGISCASCHLIKSFQKKPSSFPTFQLDPGATMYGPYDQAEDNLVHPSEKAEIYDSVNYCTTCHFSKVKDVTQPHLDGSILRNMVCQDCHMEQSTGSSTSKRGRLTRSIGRHWFQGIVKPGLMLSNRNVQAEWSARLNIDFKKSQSRVDGIVKIRNGSLTHMFPGGDPILRQFFLNLTLKDEAGNIVAIDRKQFGRNFEQLMEHPITQPLVNGGTTREIPFSIAFADNLSPTRIEASLSYALIPEPGAELKKRYFVTLSGEQERQEAEAIIAQYTSQRLLTFRTKSLKSTKP